MLVNAQQPGHMDNECVFCSVTVYTDLAACIGNEQAIAIIGTSKLRMCNTFHLDDSQWYYSCFTGSTFNALYLS